MRLKILEHDDLKFYVREGTSDEKAFREVIEKNSYQRKYFQIESGEEWIDLGGNVGAFALMVLKNNAKVKIYEPDPFSCRMIEKNLKLNNFDADIIQKAVVSSDQKKMRMYVGNNKQVWRNSLYKDWGNEVFNVDTIHFSEVLNSKKICCKMDIEGAEMSILEGLQIFPKKLVFEWSFDVDESINRYRKIVNKMKKHYKNVKAPSFSHDYVMWQKSWFPPCANVYNY